MRQNALRNHGNQGKMGISILLLIDSILLNIMYILKYNFFCSIIERKNK
jgi:hypothetical protein